MLKGSKNVQNLLFCAHTLCMNYCKEFIPCSDLQQLAKVIPTEFKLEFQSSIHQRNMYTEKNEGVKLHHVIT